MGYIWPRLPLGAARELFDSLVAGTDPSESGTAQIHPKAFFAPVGDRVTASFAMRTREKVLEIARACGYPGAGDDRSREAFDLEVTHASAELFPMGWAEAGSQEVWNNLALVLLADVTRWRWSHVEKLNVERFIATDFTRHTWARLWWRNVQMSGDMSILEFLGERNTNQFLERRDSVGTSRELIGALMRSLEAHRRDESRAPALLVRDTTARALRQMAIIDDSALDDADRGSWTDDMVESSLRALGE